jgi:MATE family multidrug resistance protein
MTPVRLELGALWRLAWPLVLTQLGFMMLGVDDTLLLGHLSADALGAAALANSWAWGVLALGMGIVLGIDPLIAQAWGERDADGVAVALQRGLVVAAIVSVPVTVLVCLTGPGLVWLGQKREIAEQAQLYNVIRAPSGAFFLAFTALRSWLVGRGIVRPVMWVSVAVNVLNAFFGWALIFGELGFPRLEIAGAALVASLVVIAQPPLLLALVRWGGLAEGAWRPWSRRSFAPRGIAQVFRLGVPIGLQLSLEGWAFSFATMMSGWLGVAALAGHTIVLSLISLWFQVPLGIALAATVRVGNAIGAGDADQARRSAAIALGFGAGVMLVAAAVFSGFRQELPRLYTSDAEVIALAALALPIAAAFQLFDGLQVVSGGILRGAGRTNAPAWVNLFGYFAIALPLSWRFGFADEGGIEGVWWGLVVGLFAVATLMLVQVWRASHRPLAELRVGVH